MVGDRKGFTWLERHIDNASSEVSRWPAWKSQGSTLDMQQPPNENANLRRDQSHPPLNESPSDGA